MDDVLWATDVNTPKQKECQFAVNNSQNRSAENGNRSAANQISPKVIYQTEQSRGPSGLPKPKQTKFSGDSLEWPEWSGLFDVVVHQKPISDTENMQYLKISLTGQAKAPISRIRLSWQSCLRYALWEVWQIRCLRQHSIQEKTYSSSSLARQLYEHCQNCKCRYKCELVSTDKLVLWKN